MAGQAVAVAFTVGVAEPGAGKPAGTVTVSDGATSCSGALAAGSGSCELVLATAGAHDLVASYPGDGQFSPSASDPTAHQVDQAATTTTITEHLPAPSLVGQEVRVEWQVAVSPPGAATPTGTVEVSGGTASCSAPVADGGCELALARRGIIPLGAAYSGDADLLPSAARPVNHRVVNTAMALAASANPSTAGQEVLFTATLTAIPGTPVGEVAFAVDGVPTAAATPVRAGGAGGERGILVATWATASLAPGLHVVTATYAGSDDHDGCQAALEQEVQVGVGFLGPTEVEVVEADGAVTLRVDLVAATTLPVTVLAAAADGTALAGEDYLAALAPVVIEPGLTWAELVVPLVADSVWEPDETFSVYLVAAEHAVVVPPGETVVTVRDPGPTDLAVTKTSGGDDVVAGDPVTYTITVTSTGPSWACGVTVVDGLPDDLAQVSWTCTATPDSSCSPSGVDVLWDEATLAPGGQITYLLTGTVEPDATTPLHNAVSIAAPAGIVDPNPANDWASDADTVWYPIFRDGFEGGDSAAWSATSP